jgi:phage N-6-adenine-methyltransferase
MSPQDSENEYTGDMTSRAHFENQSDERGTPLTLIRPLKRVVEFDLDPASGCEPEPIAPNRYTKEDDGLARPWWGHVWLNPPYSEIADWMEKAAKEAQGVDVDSIMALVPNRTSTRWFHDYATTADRYVVLDGRLKYEHTDGSAPFPSAVFVWGADALPSEAMDELAERGEVYEIARERRTKQSGLEGFE